MLVLQYIYIYILYDKNIYNEFTNISKLSLSESGPISNF